MIAKGTEVSVTVTGTVSESFGWSQYSTADLRNDVMRILSSRLNVTAFNIKGDESWMMETWSYRAMLTVKTISDHARIEDVLSIVDGAFWQAADTKPVVTLGEYSQQDPSEGRPGAPSATSTLSSIAIIIVGAIVLLIWAKP